MQTIFNLFIEFSEIQTKRYGMQKIWDHWLEWEQWIINPAEPNRIVHPAKSNHNEKWMFFWFEIKWNDLWLTRELFCLTSNIKKSINIGAQ